jgi:hypothetical protein
LNSHLTLVMRVVALMAVVFACGMWIGRMTDPKVPPADPNSIGESSGDFHMPPRVAKVFSSYVQELELNAEQEEKLAPLLKEYAKRMAGMPKNSEERFGELGSFHERMGEFLSEKQKLKAAEILESARQRRGGE